MNNDRKKNKKEEIQQEEEAKWLTTFNDLMTLLLTFFVLLFSMSSLDFKKMKTFQNSLQSALGILEAGKMTQVEIRPFEVESLAEEMLAEKKNIDELKDELASESSIEVAATQEGAIITFKDTLLFDSGKASINSAALPFLDKVGAMIKKTKYYVRVEGHTDDTPINTKRFPSNWELSTARAVNVVKHFVESGKVVPQRMSAAGYGESKPLFSNDTRDHKARNRRVEITLIKEEDRAKCQK